jgi:hypothetical protein
VEGRLAILLAVGGMALAAPAEVRAAQPPAPTPLSPDDGASLAAGANITFRASADPDPGMMQFYVSTGIDVDADGVLLNPIAVLVGDPAGGGVYEAGPSSADWTKTPGTYYWQPVYKDCTGPGDCFIEGPTRSFAIHAVPAPEPLAPDDGDSFTVGDRIRFRASTVARPDFMRFYVSTDTETDSNGVLLSKTDLILGTERSDQPGVYGGGPGSADWAKTPGTYYWQPVYMDCSHVLDCFNEGPIQSFTVTAVNTFFTRHPPHRTHKRRVRFAFSSNSARARFQCYYAQGWTSCRSPVIFRHLTPGRYEFKVRAIANGEKDPTPARWLFRVRR